MSDAVETPYGQVPAVHEPIEPKHGKFAFITPKKKISDDADVQKWLTSDGFTRIMDFLFIVNESLINPQDHRLNAVGGSRRIVPEEHHLELDTVEAYEAWKLENEQLRSKRLFVSPIIKELGHMLDEIDQITDDVPPQEATADHRFGNRAFKDWIAKLHLKLRPGPRNLLLETVCVRHAQLNSAMVELSPYLAEAFGNGVRIDYGSGHELSFVAFLTMLYHLDLLTKYDLPPIALVVMNRYIQICRRIQRTYNLEPAGSHGVWGLDDYQFVPYMWGSGQLVGQDVIKPKHTTTLDQIAHLKHEYLWFGCIDYINQVKRGPFFEHSPMLNDIAGVPAWTKVNRGLFKMYIGEVLSKRVIVQHLLFGSIITLDPKSSPSTE